MEIIIATAAAVFFFGMLITPIILKTGAPLLLLFLGLGMILGEDGPGGFHFDDFQFAYQLGSIALAIILFTGGLETQLKSIRKAWLPALSMATLGVCLTTAILAVLVSLLIGMPLLNALLLGAVIGSTDAAATFMLLQQSRTPLPDRTNQTILLESGLNDPFAIFLTLVFVGIVDSGFSSIGWPTLQLFVSQIGLGLTLGLLGGASLAWMLNHIKLLPGMRPVFILSGGLLLFGVTTAVNGSAFLAVYLCGLIVRDRAKQNVERVVNFHMAMAWISQIGLFVMLGLLVTPSDLPAALGNALVIAAVLMFVARPLATLISLAPMGYPLREKLFIGWVGLRGAVPIFLAVIPVISPGPMTTSFFNEVFIVVIASLVLQGWTIKPAARLLGLSGDPEDPAPGGQTSKP